MSAPQAASRFDPGKRYADLVREIRQYKALASAVSLSVTGYETIRVNGSNLYSTEGRYVSRPLIPGTPCYRHAKAMKDRFTRQAAKLQKQLAALGPNPHDTFKPLPADKCEARIRQQYDPAWTPQMF